MAHVNMAHASTLAVLLRRRGVVFAEAKPGGVGDGLAQAVSLQMSALGYVLSQRLQDRLSTWAGRDLSELQRWMWLVLSEQLGADREHMPLFRKFPRDVPDDTTELWWRKVLSHFLQADGQPCIFCAETGTTHVLSPCRHVVCDRCFDGANYSACPVCEHRVDADSPFFQPDGAEQSRTPDERVTFRLLDLAEDAEGAARELFQGFCARAQPLSPQDRDDLQVLIGDRGLEVLPWLPDAIQVRETTALVLGELFRVCDVDDALIVARRYLRTATDVLRFLAAYSGADPALQRETIFKEVEPPAQRESWWDEIAKRLGRAPERTVSIPLRVRRFPMAKLSRPLRRAILELLNGFARESLIEDMLRHRSYWVWVGEFLHPFEYRKRFPVAAEAFQLVRRKLPDGTRAPRFEGYDSRLDAARRRGDATAFVDLLCQRPGVLARQLDHALRFSVADRPAADRLMGEFAKVAPSLPTPMLATLLHHFPGRTRPAEVRIFWPKGAVAKGVSSPDRRRTLAPTVVDATTRVVEAELLRRFGELPEHDVFVIDEALRDVMAPFNERTASRSAVDLPRGSTIDVESGKVARLFLHWCEPQTGGYTTDLDLSVGFYAADWTYRGVCSYYELEHESDIHGLIAQSAGDLRSAPYPDGSTEIVDLLCGTALASGIRYAVMVVNSYAGMPFSRLERGFAGLMFRDDPTGAHFDPRTVKLRFQLAGESGIYMPIVFDLEKQRMHWLDVYSKGQLGFDNVETSNAAIRKICPELITYFASGVRMSMFDLATLHAAGRARRVVTRSNGATTLFERESGEEPRDFLRRLRAGERGQAVVTPPRTESTFAVLFHGDLDLPDGSPCYALFDEMGSRNTSASDLIR